MELLFALRQKSDLLVCFYWKSLALDKPQGISSRGLRTESRFVLGEWWGGARRAKQHQLEAFRRDKEREKRVHHVFVESQSV